MAETQQKCGGCEHWHAIILNPPAPFPTGKCLRFPPVLDPLQGARPLENVGHWIWPICTADSTCGEWTARGGTPPASQLAFDQGAFA